MIGFAVVLPDSADFMAGALAMLGVVGLVRFSQTNHAVSRALRPLWGLIVGFVAALFGPALILPALAKIKHAGALLPVPHEVVGPLVFGTLITICGLGLIAYSVGRNLRAERA